MQPAYSLPDSISVSPALEMRKTMSSHPHLANAKVLKYIGLQISTNAKKKKIQEQHWCFTLVPRNKCCDSTSASHPGNLTPYHAQALLELLLREAAIHHLSFVYKCPLLYHKPPHSCGLPDLVRFVPCKP